MSEKEYHIHTIFDRLVSRGEKERFLNQRSRVFWFTGLSGSGKSTLATSVERLLFQQGYFVQTLDGDNIRSGISNNLSFSLDDRKENIRRIAEVAKLFLQSGIITFCTFISPTRDIRTMARKIIGSGDFSLIYIKCTLAECERRDVKGLYAKARQGLITGFTGIDSPYEEPLDPDLIINTQEEGIDQSTEKIVEFICQLISPL